jgi:hypothetical protein
MLLSFYPAACAQRQGCSVSQAERAETRAGTVRSWNALYSWFTEYRNCDDGVIAETSSESVARLLVDHWNTTSRLAFLASRNADFRRFVLRHVDASLDTDDLKKIAEHSTRQCRTEFRGLCADLAKNANAAIREGASFQ